MNALVSARADYDLDEELKLGRRDGSLLVSKAMMILEEIGLPDSARALADPRVPQDQKERVKVNLMKIARIDSPSTMAATGQLFSITFNLGGPDRPVAHPAPLNITPPLTRDVEGVFARAGGRLT
jgi:hypothetical protein